VIFYRHLSSTIC